MCTNEGVNCTEYKYMGGTPFKYGVCVSIGPESPDIVGGYRDEIGRGHDFGSVS